MKKVCYFIWRTFLYNNKGRDIHATTFKTYSFILINDNNLLFNIGANNLR